MAIGIGLKNVYQSMHLRRCTDYSLFFFFFCQYEFKTKDKCKLFDQPVAPVSNYSSEIWGLHQAKDVENVHTKFLRKILGVKKSRNLIGLYGEKEGCPCKSYEKLTSLYIGTSYCFKMKTGLLNKFT